MVTVINAIYEVLVCIKIGKKEKGSWQHLHTRLKSSCLKNQTYYEQVFDETRGPDLGSAFFHENLSFNCSMALTSVRSIKIDTQIA